MIPGLEHYNKTGDTSLLLAYLELEKDDLRVLVETAYTIILDFRDVDKEYGWSTAEIDDWLVVAKRELEG